MNVSLDQKCVNTIRTLSMDAVQKANSGHPGTAMALAPVMHTLFDRYLDHSPSNPEFANRDRFVLSIGHASMLIYSTLHLTGYDLPLEDLKNFRQWGSKVCRPSRIRALSPGWRPPPDLLAKVLRPA